MCVETSKRFGFFTLSEELYDNTLMTPKIILISDGKQNARNHKFIVNVKYIESNIEIMDEICPGGVVGTIKALELYP